MPLINARNWSSRLNGLPHLPVNISRPPCFVCSSARHLLQTNALWPPTHSVAIVYDTVVLVDPGHLAVSDEFRTAEERFLLLTSFGEFWAVIVLDYDSGIRQAALLY